MAKSNTYSAHCASCYVLKKTHSVNKNASNKCTFQNLRITKSARLCTPTKPRILRNYGKTSRYLVLTAKILGAVANVRTNAVFGIELYSMPSPQCRPNIYSKGGHCARLCFEREYRLSYCYNRSAYDAMFIGYYYPPQKMYYICNTRKIRFRWIAIDFPILVFFFPQVLSNPHFPLASNKSSCRNILLRERIRHNRIQATVYP